MLVKMTLARMQVMLWFMEQGGLLGSWDAALADNISIM